MNLTKSDLADLARYPASLQQTALALWGRERIDRVGIPNRAAFGGTNKNLDIQGIT